MDRGRLILCMAAFVFLAASCRSVKYVPVETVRSDTTYITKHERDSIFVHDSVHVKEHQSGDTIYVEVEKVKRVFKEKLVHDTVYVSKHDTIPSPYPVEVKVEKPLTWWQSFRLSWFPWLLAMVIGLLGYVFRRPIKSLLKLLLGFIK